MKKSYWFPLTRPKQRAMFLNIKSKISPLETVLPVSNDKVKRIIAICDTFLTVCDYVEQTRATMQSLTDWQNLIFDGGDGFKTGDPAPAAPAFASVTLPATAFINIFEEFKALVDDIKHADNYTEAIGEDLMIVGEESEDIVLDDLIAGLTKVQPVIGYKINLDGSLQGMKMMRVEYWAKGATIPQVDKFDKLPAVMTIFPKTAGEPEAGYLRAFLLADNEQIGQPSPDYPVTLS